MCSGGGGGGGDGGAAAREAERQARIAAGTSAVNSIFADPGRSQIYDTVGADTKNYYSKQLEEDRAEALRQMEFQKARTGTFGSSQGIDLDGEFQKRYDRGLLDVGNRADSAASNILSNDEQARVSLLGKIAAGMDQGSATSSAMEQLKSNADLGRQNSMQARMANVFSDLLAGFNNGQMIAGQNAAKQQYGNQLGNYVPGTGDNGTIAR